MASDDLASRRHHANLRLVPSEPRAVAECAGGLAAPQAMLFSAARLKLNIELAAGRVRPSGGQGTARSIFARGSAGGL